jgi:hypothetical protein
VYKRQGYDNARLLLWPPFYPLLLAFLGFLFRCDPLLTIGWLNPILFAFIVFISGIITFRLTKGSVLFALLTSLFITFSIPLYGVALMAWSEPLFIFLVVLFFLALQKYADSQKGSTLLILALLAALASITRYVGVALIFTGAVGLFLIPESTLKRKLLRVLIFAFTASLPLAAWLVRNFLISGTLTGQRLVSTYTLLDNFQAFISILFYWLFPKSLYSSRMFIAVLFFGLGLLVSLLRRKVVFHKVKMNIPLTSLAVFCVIYIVLLLISSRSGFWGLLDSRYLSPVFIPMTLVLFAILHKLPGMLKGQYRSWFGTLVVGLLVTELLAHSMITTIRNSLNPIPFREGYNPTYILNSKTMRYLQANPGVLRDCPTYTNSPVELDFFAHFQAEPVPAKLAGEYSSMVAADIDQLKGTWPPENSCLVWFAGTQPAYLYTLTELETVADFSKMKSFEDGVIYQIKKK